MSGTDDVTVIEVDHHAVARPSAHPNFTSEKPRITSDGSHELVVASKVSMRRF